MTNEEKCTKLTEWFEHQRIVLESFDCATAGSEDIHQFRLAIKKLRAWDNFLLVVDKKHRQLTKKVHELDKIFKRAGKIRDVQISVQLMDEYEERHGILCDDFRLYLLNLQSKLHNQFMDKFDADFLRELDKYASRELARIVPDAPWLEEKVLLQHFWDKAQAMKKKASKVKKNKQLHDYRTFYKSAMYTMRFIRDMVPNALKEYSLGEINDRSHELGVWHDKEVVLEFIEQFVHSHPAYLDKDLKKLRRILSDESQSFVDWFRKEAERG